MVLCFANGPVVALCHHHSFVSITRADLATAVNILSLYLTAVSHCRVQAHAQREAALQQEVESLRAAVADHGQKEDFILGEAQKLRDAIAAQTHGSVEDDPGNQTRHSLSWLKLAVSMFGPACSHNTCCSTPPALTTTCSTNHQTAFKRNLLTQFLTPFV